MSRMLFPMLWLLALGLVLGPALLGLGRPGLGLACLSHPVACRAMPVADGAPEAGGPVSAVLPSSSRSDG